MSLENFKVSLGGVTRNLTSLPFYSGGEVEKVTRKGEVFIRYGIYKFTVTETSLGYRSKPEGRKVFSTMKSLGSFEELEELLNPSSLDVKRDKNYKRAEGAKEDLLMANLVIDGKKHPIPSNVHTILKKLGAKAGDIDAGQFDELIAKATGADAKTLEDFDNSITEDIAATPKTEAPKTEAPKTEAPKTEAPKTEAPKQDGAPVTPPAGGTPLRGSDVFGGGQSRQESPSADPGESGSRGRTKTKAERDAERQARLLKEQQNEKKLNQVTGQIETYRRAQSEIDGADEAQTALKKLILIEDKVPFFRTLVASDTRLRAECKDTIAPKDRQYHPSLRGNPDFKETGAKIELKYSDAKYELRLRESTPSSPQGYFLWVPEALLNFEPSRLALFSERQLVINAAAEFDPENRNLVIKYFNKQEMVNLLLLLGDVLVQEYEPEFNSYVTTAPVITLDSRSDSKRGNVTVYYLRAKVLNPDNTWRNTKLSIRRFIPLVTHETTRLGNDFDAVLTTQALFHRLLWNKTTGAADIKFNQLTEASAALFTKTPEGDYKYNAFQNSFEVLAYDSTAARPENTIVGLPLVEASKPTSNNAVAAPRFVRHKHTEDGYNIKYVADRDMVGNQIKNVRNPSVKSRLQEHSALAARQQAALNLFKGSLPTSK